MNKKITIIIVTYNGRQYLSDCLGSVERQDYPRKLVRVVVVDNDSSDSTVGYVKEKHPLVKVIANRRNFGFARANNQGYFLAQKNQSDYLVLLNQDTLVEKNWLGRLVKLAAEDETVAAVQPKLLLHPQTDLINSLGNSVHFLGFAFCNYYKKRDKQNITEPFEIPYPSGAACLLKMSALEQTGLFDEKLFMYHEDVDLGWRLKLAGYKSLLDPLAVVYHKYHYSKAKYKFYYLDRNRWVVLLENYRLLTLLLFLPALLAMEAGVFLFAIKNGWVKEKLMSYFWLIAHGPSILSQRINVQFKIRQVKDREVLKNFVGAISFQEVDNPLLRFVVNPLLAVYFFVVKRIIFW